MPQPNLIRFGPAGDLQDLSQFGRNYIERWEEGLFREERASDTTLRRDIIGRKRAFTIAWNTADQSVVDRIEDMFQESGPLILEVTHMLDVQTYNVLMQPFEKSRLLAVYGGLWEGLTLELREV